MGLSLFDLSDRVAIVTGGSRGIGRAIALGFAEAGAHLVIAARTLPDMEEAAAEVRARGRKALTVATDVRREGQVDNLVRRTLEEFGQIDILVNNAGSYMWRPAVEMSSRAWDGMFHANMRSVFLGSRAVARAMMKQRGGTIINISSMAGLVPDPGRTAYSAAKAGVINFTRNLAIELAPYNIRVNAIAPGLVMTPGIKQEVLGMRKKRPDFRTTIVDRVPLGRVGRPEELVGAAIYLASPASSYVTGTTLEVAGG
jgi:NAD(P)-dependent dehydrogenase (short-subunit alcohol dehydrogenase family)